MIKPRKKQADVLFVKLSAGHQRRAAILSPLIFPQKPGSLLPGFCVAAKKPSRFQFCGKLLQLDAEKGLLVKLRRVAPQPAHRFHPVADGVGMLVQRPGGLVHISAAPDEGGQGVQKGGAVLLVIGPHFRQLAAALLPAAGGVQQGQEIPVCSR